MADVGDELADAGPDLTSVDADDHALRIADQGTPLCLRLDRVGRVLGPYMGPLLSAAARHGELALLLSPYSSFGQRDEAGDAHAVDSGQKFLVGHNARLIDKTSVSGINGNASDTRNGLPTHVAKSQTTEILSRSSKFGSPSVFRITGLNTSLSMIPRT